MGLAQLCLEGLDKLVVRGGCLLSRLQFALSDGQLGLHGGHLALRRLCADLECRKAALRLLKLHGLALGV